MSTVPTDSSPCYLILKKKFSCGQEGTLARLSMANMALAGLTLLPHSLCLTKPFAFLKPAIKVYILIWPFPPPGADYQGLAVKALKSSYQKPSLAHPINTPN